jgi:hypothetical protein
MPESDELGGLWLVLFVILEEKGLRTPPQLAMNW